MINHELLEIQRSKARLYGLHQLDAAIEYALQGKPIRPGQLDLHARVAKLEEALAQYEPVDLDLDARIVQLEAQTEALRRERDAVRFQRDMQAQAAMRPPDPSVEDPVPDPPPVPEPDPVETPLTATPAKRIMARTKKTATNA